MFSISNLNLQLRKNSEIGLYDYQISPHYSLLCLYESSASSDTGCLIFIQQNNSLDCNIKIKKLVWISDSVVSALTINPTCDWLALAIRGGLICVLPIGALMGRVQKKYNFWKANDVTFLPNKLKNSSKVTCMKWWTSTRDKHYCLIGNIDGDFLIVDLTNGTVLFSERFPNHILMIDLLHSNDKCSSYCIVTSKVLSQWKLLLEENHDKEPLIDNEFGFEQLDFCNLQSSSILNSKSVKQSKEQVVNPAYLPSKMYQFPQSTFLKSQYYNGKYFLGAYDKASGKYKLFDFGNLESALFEYQLPLGVLDICVTADLLYVVVGSNGNQYHLDSPSRATSIRPGRVGLGSSGQHLGDTNSVNTSSHNDNGNDNSHLFTSIADGAVIVSSNKYPSNDISDINKSPKHPKVERNQSNSSNSATVSNEQQFAHNRKPLKLCIMLRQYSYCHLFDNMSNPSSAISSTVSSMINVNLSYNGTFYSKSAKSASHRRQDRMNLFKPSISTVLPKILTKALLVEFELPDIFNSEELLGCINLSSFFNFNSCTNVFVGPTQKSTSGSSKSKSSGLNYIPQTYVVLPSTLHKPHLNHNQLQHQKSDSLFTSSLPNISDSTAKSSTSTTLLSDNRIQSKWNYQESKHINPLFVMSSSGITVCYLSQCLEDKFIDHLLADQVKKAEWIGVGLKLDMNQLYQFTANLLASCSVKVADSVTRSTISLIVDFLDLASARMSYKLQCLIKYLPLEQCLQHCLALLTQINKMTPGDRMFLSDALVLLFGQVMSDPLDYLDNGFVKRNKYHEKFRRFIINNCFFNDLKAAKTLVKFGLVEEAFYVAKEKGCILELFTFLADNNYSTKWAKIFQQENLVTKYSKLDQDFVLSSIGTMELEIVARSDPKLIKSMAEFICNLFCSVSLSNDSACILPVPNASSSNQSLSFKTTTHLCIAFNPFGSILDTLFRIYRSSATTNTPINNSNLTASMILGQSIESLTNPGHQFSTETVRIRREIGPCLLAYCLLVIYRDNLIHNNTATTTPTDHFQPITTTQKIRRHKSLAPNSTNKIREVKAEVNFSCFNRSNSSSSLSSNYDYTYFVHMHRVLLQFVSHKSYAKHNDATSQSLTQNTSVVHKSSCILMNSEGVTMGPADSNSFESILRMISSNKGLKPKRNLLSKYWKSRETNQLLGLRDNFCVSVSVFDIDLFDVQSGSSGGLLAAATIGNSTSPLVEDRTIKRCQINMLGFQWRCDKSNRVLLLPKEIESGREVVRQVAVGKRHALILCDNGEIYGAGSNDFGQLGLESQNTLGRHSNNKSSNNGLNIELPCSINLELNRNEQILSICAGDFHSGALIVSTSDQHYELPRSYIATWGWGVHGQLGHGNYFDQRQPKRLAWNFIVDVQNNPEQFSSPDITDNSVESSYINSTEKTAQNKIEISKILKSNTRQFPVQLEMGAYHTVILTNQGQVYTFGNNTFGQLGVPKIQKSTKPIRVDRLPSNISLISTRFFHTVVSNPDNEIYTWGISAALWLTPSHQMRSHHDIATPKSISTGNLLLNEKIAKISCGMNHSVVVTENRLVYSFGNNIFGQLGLGNRREINNLVEVKVPKPIDFIVSDDGVSIAMNITDKSTTLYTWGKSSHPLIHENMRNISGDALKPQLLAEYKHIFSSNLSGQNCFGVDTINSGSSSILNKHQLMIIFLNFSRYMERKTLINSLINLNEIDIVSDYFLVNDLLIESLFWRIKSLSNQLALNKCQANDPMKSFGRDVVVIFDFYIKQTKREKYYHLSQSVLTMICGFFKCNNYLWTEFEKLFSPLIKSNTDIVTHLFVKYQLSKNVSSKFIRSLLYRIVNDQQLTNSPYSQSNYYHMGDVLKSTNSNRDLHLNGSQQPPITLNDKEIDHIVELMQTEDPDAVFDAADDHKAIVFSQCSHLMLLGKFREGPLKLLIEKLRKHQMNLSGQAVQRLYGDSCVLPECIECLIPRI